jgi:hypothetical protein
VVAVLPGELGHLVGTCTRASSWTINPEYAGSMPAGAALALSPQTHSCSGSVLWDALGWSPTKFMPVRRASPPRFVSSARLPPALTVTNRAVATSILS